MYFVVLRLQKVIKKRYILDQKFILFRDPLFYRFFIDFGRAQAPRKWSLGARGAFSKKKRCLKKGSTWRPGGLQGSTPEIYAHPREDP